MKLGTCAGGLHWGLMKVSHTDSGGNSGVHLFCDLWSNVGCLLLGWWNRILEMGKIPIHRKRNHWQAIPCIHTVHYAHYMFVHSWFLKKSIYMYTYALDNFHSYFVFKHAICTVARKSTCSMESICVYLAFLVFNVIIIIPSHHHHHPHHHVSL